MARRPARRLSPDDRAAWNQVKATATPLRPLTERDVPPVPTTPPAPAKTAKPGPPAKPTVQGSPVSAPPSGPLPAMSVHPAMDRRRFEKLRRGRLEPEARLDLHGMTSERAHAALTRFITGAHADGKRLVLVITGKGRPADWQGQVPHRHGILRHSVPHWLAAPPLALKVLDIAPAHQKHGGSGALYVYLRRLR